MNVRVNWRVSLDLAGTTLLYLAVLLVFPLLVAVCYDELLLPFLVTIGLTLLLGVWLNALGGSADLGIPAAFPATVLVWGLIAVIGAVAFLVAGTGTRHSR